MTVVLTNSVITNAAEGQLISLSSYVDIGSSPNSKALKLDGNRLEVIAAVSIIEASHHKYKDMYSTLSGQNCFDFVRTIVSNLRKDIGVHDICRRIETMLKLPILQTI